MFTHTAARSPFGPPLEPKLVSLSLAAQELSPMSLPEASRVSLWKQGSSRGLAPARFRNESEL